MEARLLSAEERFALRKAWRNLSDAQDAEARAFNRGRWGHTFSTDMRNKGRCGQRSKRGVRTYWQSRVNAGLAMAERGMFTDPDNAPRWLHDRKRFREAELKDPNSRPLKRARREAAIAADSKIKSLHDLELSADLGVENADSIVWYRADDTKALLKRVAQLTPAGKMEGLAHLEVDVSKFLAAIGVQGRGLYAKQAIQKGAIIGEYKGVRLDIRALKGRLQLDRFGNPAPEKAHLQRYMFDIIDDVSGAFRCAIDGADESSSSILRYINSRTSSKSEKGLQNIKFQQVFRTECIIAIALKFIPAGSEIIGWYGPATRKNIVL